MAVFSQNLWTCPRRMPGEVWFVTQVRVGCYENIRATGSVWRHFFFSWHRSVLTFLPSSNFCFLFCYIIHLLLYPTLQAAIMLFQPRRYRKPRTHRVLRTGKLLAVLRLRMSNSIARSQFSRIQNASRVRGYSRRSAVSCDNFRWRELDYVRSSEHAGYRYMCADSAMDVFIEMLTYLVEWSSRFWYADRSLRTKDELSSSFLMTTVE